MNAVRPSRQLGAIGSVVGLLALVVSSLTYLLPTDFFAERFDRRTVETGQRVKDHQTLRIKGLEIIRSREAHEQPTVGEKWNQGISTAAVALGLLAIVLAVVSVILREEKLLAGIAAVLGITAIGVQLFWIMVAILILMAIASALLS